MAPPPMTDRASRLLRIAQLGLSGAAYTLLALAFNQWWGTGSDGARLLDGHDGGIVAALFTMSYSTLPLTWLTAWGFARLFRADGWRTWGVMWRWGLGMFGLWLVSRFTGPVGLLLFVGWWAAYAFLAAPRRTPPAVNATPGKAKPQPKTGSAPTPPKRTFQGRGRTPGRFGRVPQETEALLKELVQQVTGPVTKAVPVDAPAEVRRTTIRLVLAAVLQTWWTDARAVRLDPADIERLQGTIALAAHLAGNRFDTVGQGLYRGVLRGLLNGWLRDRL